MLKTKHFFPFIKMVKALDIKDTLKEFYQKTKGSTQEELEQLDESESFDFIYIFVEKLPLAEKEVMSFLSVFLEKSQEDVNEMAITEIIDVIKGVFQDPNFKVFFQAAVK